MHTVSPIHVTCFSWLHKSRTNFPKTRSTLDQKGKYSHQAKALFLCDHKCSKFYLVFRSRLMGKKNQINLWNQGNISFVRCHNLLYLISN